jgi:Na+:H+ antiporter, NhaA family
LHYPVAFIILPIFALANTAIKFPQDMTAAFVSNNALGIMMGLIVGKFVGIFLLSFLSVKTGIAQLSGGLRWIHIAGISFLGGIGFTMSIFISNLAFDDPAIITGAKISILVGSFVSALLGSLLLSRAAKNPGKPITGF